ncbi:1742_t:CDS:2, partial [Acaulospora morrowiae]
SEIACGVAYGIGHGSSILDILARPIDCDATSLPMSALQYSSTQSSPTTPTITQTQLYPQHIMSLQPPSPQPAKMSTNTFVHKLYNMVVDKQYQHLIAWNYTGSSFIVCNIMEFSRDVLPKHFKHNNFSSFVRQLNMYGFHKVNKSPRGHRTLAENQIWEFSHAKFLRGRPDLLDDIKRKAMESETLRRETGDLHALIAMMQVAQNELTQQIRQLQENFAEVMRDLTETKKKQTIQQVWMKNMVEYISQQHGTASSIPLELNLESFESKPEPERPPIYITSAEHQNMSYMISHSNIPSRPSTPLTVDTSIVSSPSQTGSHGQSPNRVMNIQLPSGSPFLDNAILSNTPLSPNSFNTFTTAINTPLPPSPSPGSPMGHLSDDEMDSSYYCASPGDTYIN